MSFGALDPGSGMQLSFIGRTISECTSCPSEPNVAGCCRFPANAEERQHLSECIDAGCAEPVCDECSHHEDCCDDCLVDCGSDCGTSFGCDELDVRVDDTYVFEGSHSELFGDQTAQTFGFGCRLPRLAMDNTITESGNFGKTLDDTRSSTLPAHGMNQSYPGSKIQSYPSFQTPWAPHTPLNAPEATTPSGASYDSDFLGLRNHELAPANVSPLARNGDPLTYTSDSTHDSPDPMDFSPSAHYDHVNLLTEECDPTRPFHPSLRCQWADPNGKPCGKNLRLGNDMHEHLKSAHGVKSGVFCRWVGCTVGVFGASLHKFASSVERHTWGHSGYRPYKCSACNEGFAAASVRDEHYTNIHLRKKVFSCDLCPHQCTSATNLKRHKDDKHSAERFQCEFCNRNDKRRLFPRGPNLARHFRNCKYVQAQFPEAAAAGKAKADWLPPGYKRGHHGMDRAKVTPPNYLPAQMDT
ncbi:hypothetical protein HO133_009915 [Letharia lupina]|uniref:C2H2-type domain-containing protein n=1 Tax=Letharia lupina TaxID=560253 RepID=A0A8H6FDQ5_9LECA|nr:uncharacterized protein HO133_009915 [Letharia lupina]KAF6224722.1 hypothetical protein HO133_009915 [Letharia lupina]